MCAEEEKIPKNKWGKTQNFVYKMTVLVLYSGRIDQRSSGVSKLLNADPESDEVDVTRSTCRNDV
jgi:hypothetical protein